MVVRIIAAFVLIATIHNELAAQQENAIAKVGDTIFIEMTGDLAKEFAQRTGATPEVLAAKGLEIQTSATVVQLLDGGRLRIEHHIPINSQGHRILIAGKTAQNAFEEVFIPSGLESFAAEASF